VRRHPGDFQARFTCGEIRARPLLEFNSGKGFFIKQGMIKNEVMRITNLRIMGNRNQMKFSA
jgi:hypothetical protein